MTNSMYQERLPPSNTEAEEALLGALLLDTETAMTIGRIVRPGDFYREKHMQVYAAMLALVDAGGVTDQVSVADELVKRGMLATVGGQEFLSHCVAQCPSPLYAEHYAKIIRRCADARRIIRLGGEVANAGYEDNAPAALEAVNALWAEAAERENLSGPLPIATIIDRVVDKLSARFSPRQPGQVLGVSTGIKDLDYALDGLVPGRTYLVAARTSMGKTELVDHMMRAVAAQGLHVLLFVNEGLEEDHVERLAYQIAHVDRYDLHNPQRADDVAHKLWEAVGELHDNPNIFIHPVPEMSTAEIRMHVLTHKAQHPDKLGLVIYDQIDLNKESKARDQNDMRAIAIKHLNATARMAKVPVVVAAQLNRDSEKRDDKRPTLADIRWSGDMEQHVQGLMLLFRAAYYIERGTSPRRFMPDEEHPLEMRDYDPARDKYRLEVIVPKNTSGRVAKVNVFWDPARHIMGDWKEAR